MFTLLKINKSKIISSIAYSTEAVKNESDTFDESESNRYYNTNKVHTNIVLYKYISKQS